jgi:long-subunit acyl-CoA synthetase (AMP-forming)
MNLPSLRTITQAGGKLPKYLIDTYTFFAIQKNINFYIMYGQTEATARISCNLVNENTSKKYSIGTPIIGGTMSIDLNNNELIYSGPNVMMGYSETKEDLEKGDELKGILKTGDLAIGDSDGYFYITGRIKRFIKIRGISTNLDEIENFLQSKGFDCAVHGNDDKIYIGYTLIDSIDLIKQELKNTYTFNNLNIEFIKLNEILRGDNGKILYNEIFRGI